MKKWLVMLGLSVGLGLVSGQALADEAQMNVTLVKIAQQLEALKPLINQAAAEQSPNPRVQVHFDAWTDANGLSHAGLRQDIDAIQKGVIDAINHKSVDPRPIAPINGDFAGHSNEL